MPGEQLTVADQSITSRKVDLTVSSVDVTTGEATTSTSFTDLATAGPAVTLTSGVTQDHLLSISGRLSTNTNGAYVAMGPSIAGAAVSDEDTNTGNVTSSTYDFTRGRPILAIAQTSGATHTAKYKTSAGTGTFNSRRLIGSAI